MTGLFLARFQFNFQKNFSFYCHRSLSYFSRFLLLLARNLVLLDWIIIKQISGLANVYWVCQPGNKITFSLDTSREKYQNIHASYKLHKGKLKERERRLGQHDEGEECGSSPAVVWVLVIMSVLWSCHLLCFLTSVRRLLLLPLPIIYLISITY